MNKQQLAAKIWASANKMRSKIEANEYKDYILGFIFYKFLSDKEVKYLTELGYTSDDIDTVTEEDAEMVENIQKNIGYFISYENLFSTWIDMKSDFSVENVRVALSAFSRLINPSHKKVFDKVFDTLQTGLSKLGDSASSQTKSVSDLIHLIKDIPMDGKQDYDVLGFIYEYLISNFAANAGKKAGEFYTPYEVSLLMSEIVADHLKDKKEIKIYDPTSGSGSLLINIGKAVAKHMGDSNGIKYYAQELKENTYNLTRMNLVMRGILPDNIVVRNGDTLEKDWPYFEDGHYEETYERLCVDAVVSNPPYSQHWDPSDKENDPRYSRFGLAPKTKADYAFLLHDLYHLKGHGIMTIVLPHGVLFRGGTEGDIRMNLVENNHIDAIIGLPANIFFGTGIPTIIMVLRQKRDRDDVLIVDASKGYEKVGKNNKLRASDIKRIVDVVTMRQDIPKFSKIVSRDEIRKNEYNLNIPRYVDSSEKAESWDIYATMFGGVPNKELDELEPYWKVFPGARERLFTPINSEYSELNTDSVRAVIGESKAFVEMTNHALNGLEEYLNSELLVDFESVSISSEENKISDELFSRYKDVPLIDKYDIYQILDNAWTKIAVDLEIIQTEGFSATKVVDPNMVVKKKDGKEEEVQEGWVGHVIPFELVQEKLLSEELALLRAHEGRVSEITSEIEELIEMLDEENKQSLLNDDNDSFVAKELASALKEVSQEILTDEIIALKEYLECSKKNEKLSFISNHPEIDWDSMAASKDGTYAKSVVTKRIDEICKEYSFDEGTYEYVVIKASKLIEEEKTLNKSIKDETLSLHAKTKETIESLEDAQILQLLKEKWILPLVSELENLPQNITNSFVSRVESLQKKYQTTYFEVEEGIQNASYTLSALLGELTGNEFDMQGLAELKALLGGE